MSYTPNNSHLPSHFETSEHEVQNVHGKCRIISEDAALAHHTKSTTLAKASVQALSNRKTPGEWFTLITGFICVVCTWGLIDAVVELIAGDSVVTACYTYIIFSAVGIFLLIIYKKFFDNSFDPAAMLAM